MEHVRNLGFDWVHIWSCPPSQQGDDYIFYAHPKSQKFPRCHRLIDWYKKLFDVGIMDNVIEKYCDIRSYLDDIDFDADIRRLPYFDGDFWPNTIEDALTELIKTKSVANTTADQPQASQQNSTDTNEQYANGESSNPPKRLKTTASTSDAVANGGGGGGDRASSHQVNSTKKKKKKSKSSKSSADSHAEEKTDLKSELLRVLIQRIKDNAPDFFVIKLAPRCHRELYEPLGLADITFDPDVELPCEMFDGRVGFLVECKTHFREFSTIRTAKYSTAVVVYKVHERLSKEALRVANEITHHVVRRCLNPEECGNKMCWPRRFDNKPSANLPASNAMLAYLNACQGVEDNGITYTQYLTTMAAFLFLYHSYFCAGVCGSQACLRLKRTTTPEVIRKLLENNVEEQ